MKKIESERLARLETRVEDGIKGITKALDSLNDKMEGLDHIIRGNGSPGLVAKVQNLADMEETKHKQQIAKDIELRRFKYALYAGILVTVLSNILQLLRR